MWGYDYYGDDMYQDNGMYQQQYRSRKPTKREILDVLCQLVGASEYELVDEFETMRARHICRGTQSIQILEKQICPVQVYDYVVNVEYFICMNCRKLIVNRLSLELV